MNGWKITMPLDQLHAEICDNFRHCPRCGRPLMDTTDRQKPLMCLTHGSVVTLHETSYNFIFLEFNLEP